MIDYRDRQIDAKPDGEQGGGSELHGIAARDEPGKHADRDSAGDRTAVQVPQVVMGQQRAKTRDMTVLADRGVAGQIFLEQLAGHGMAIFYLVKRRTIEFIPRDPWVSSMTKVVAIAERVVRYVY